MEKSSLRILKEMDVRVERQLKIWNSLVDMENLDDRKDTGLGKIL
jgi:hypothetical protein